MRSSFFVRIGPVAVVGRARGAREQALPIQRRAAAPPLVVVGHEYAKEKVWTHFRRYAPATDK
jgi:hypothetical protein